MSSGEKVKALLAQFPDFEPLAPAASLQEVVARIDDEHPNLLIISKRLTGLPDFEVVASILQSKDVRWIAIRGSGQANTTRNLPPSGSDLFEVSAGIEPHVLAQQIRSVCRNAKTPLRDRTIASHRAPRDFDKLILLGASTGGVDSLIHVLEKFPVDAPPTVIVQHTGAAYLAGLSKLLDRRTTCSVVAADRSIQLERGKVFLAASGSHHLVFRRNAPIQCDLHEAPPVSGHRPSVDAMFQSAVPHAKRVVAVLMTGMGRDGAAGLKALKDAGAITGAQDEASSVVYGMPRVATEMGAADTILPLNKIADFVLSNANHTDRSEI